MALDKKPTETPDATDRSGLPPDDDTGSPFHYYSGGEVKELEGTRVSPVLWVFWTFVVVAAVIYLFVGGAIPSLGRFTPTEGSAANLAADQDYLLKKTGNAQLINSLDLAQVPRPQGQSLAQAIDAGSTVYQTYCIGCHGPNQDGNGVNAAALNPKPRNLHDGPFMQAMSYQRIATSLHKGVPGTAMPRWENTLTEAQIQDVIAYVWSLTTPVPTSNTQSAGGPETLSGTKNSSGGTKEYVNGVSNSPKPISPALPGNPTESTSTAPPSGSGASVHTTPTTSQPLKPATSMPSGSSASGNGSATTPAPSGGTM